MPFVLFFANVLLNVASANLSLKIRSGHDLLSELLFVRLKPL